MDIEAPEDWNTAKDMLLPVIRRATEPSHAWQAEEQASANRLIRRPFGLFLSELVMIDLPEVRMFVNQGHLDRWGVPSHVVFEAAHNVLRDHATSGLKHLPEYDLWQLDAPDGSASSRLVLKGWLQAFADQVEGPPVAIAPSPRLLLVGGLHNDTQLSRLVEISEEGFERAGSPLSPALYGADAQGRAQPLRMSPVTWHHRRINANLDLLAKRVYSDQTEQLQASTQAHLTPFRVEHQTSSGESISWCTLSSSHTTTWMPQTDYVEVEDGSDTWWIASSRIEELAPHCWRLAPTHPVWRVTPFPDPKTLALLKAASEPRP